MLSSKVDPRSVINYGTGIIAQSKVQDIYHEANVYFQKYKQERITYRTFYISKGFDITDGKGKIIEHVCKGVREKHPAQRDDSTKWRRIGWMMPSCVFPGVRQVTRLSTTMHSLVFM